MAPRADSYALQGDSSPSRRTKLLDSSGGDSPTVEKDGIKRENINQIAQKKAVKVEPKSFFANERTFIQWVSASLLLLTVSTIMMGNGEFSRTAALISFSAFILVLYATFVYFRRINLLSSATGYGYIDHVGPVILAVGVGVGVCVILFDILSASDILGSNRRLASYDPRRLLSNDIQPYGMYEDPGNCYQQPIAGINVLTYHPNDAMVDPIHDSLLVASTTEILSHPLHENEKAASHLIHLENTELGGFTTVGDRIFALSGGPQRTELLEFAWTQARALELQGVWTISDLASNINGLAFIPNGKDAEHGLLYIGVNGTIDSYQVPNRDDTLLSRVDSINIKVIGRGLGKEGKIASFHYFEGVTYLLHSSRRVLHAWDMGTGGFLAEIPLPSVDNGLFEEWKGFAFQRRPVLEDSSSLRGSKESSELLLHLTTNTPPQIWSFAVKEDGLTRGSFEFPACAAVSSSM